MYTSERLYNQPQNVFPLKWSVMFKGWNFRKIMTLPFGGKTKKREVSYVLPLKRGGFYKMSTPVILR